MQRLLAKQAVKKAPITPAILEDMVEDANKNPSLADLRLMTACLLAYAGFLRFNELVNIGPYDITIHEEKWSCIFHAARQISYAKVMSWSL